MTLKELSEATGISIATISRILNGQTNGNSDKLRRLEMAIEGSNDQKLLSRFRSISEKRKLIAVVIPDITNPFFTDVLKGIRGILHKHDYELIIMDSEENVDEEINILNTLKTLNLSGVIITPVSDADEECQSENILKDLRIPVVLVDRDVRSSSIDGVFVNNELGAYDGVMELIHNGHRNIGLIAGPTSSKPGRERLNGYVTALNEAGTDLFKVVATDLFSSDGQYINIYYSNLPVQIPAGVITLTKSSSNAPAANFNSNMRFMANPSFLMPFSVAK